MGFHDLTIAHLNNELARTILCCTCNKQLSRWRRGSWKAFILFCACIGSMNQIGTPLPALSPQGGERVAGRPGEGRFTESFHDLTIAHPNDEPTPSPALRAPSPPRRGRGRGEGAVHGQGWHLAGPKIRNGNAPSVPFRNVPC